VISHHKYHATQQDTGYNIGGDARASMLQEKWKHLQLKQKFKGFCLPVILLYGIIDWQDKKLSKE